MIWTLPLCQRRSGLPQRRYFPSSSFENQIETKPRQQTLLKDTVQWAVVFLLAVAQEQRSTLPKGAGCCVMMKKFAEHRCVPHPSPLVLGMG